MLMRKITKTVLGLLLTSSALLAENASAEHFKIKDGSVGGIIDDTVIYIYSGQKNDDIKHAVKLLPKIAQTQICKDKDMRNIVENLKMQVIYIYMSKQGNASIVKINDCNGIEKSTK